MNCTSCGHANREQAGFCEKCGTRLVHTCAHCQAELRPNARFCDACGKAVAWVEAPAAYTPRHLAEKILSQRSALEGERRNVTVLFCDVQGYTALAEKLDEETVYAEMQDFLGKMLDAVHRFEGTVNQFLGDGIMALFGAPVAHEDDARRAVAAALEIQRALGGGKVRCRIGVNSGPVVIGKIGDNLRMDYTAVGDTTNLASRLQSQAEPGSVLISQSTHRQVRDFFECTELGELTVKGKGRPVRAFRVDGEKPVRSRFEAAALRGLTPLVGRTPELGLLQSCWDRAQAGQGQVVLISGDAGVGKSRLLLEFRTALGREVPWREGHCSSYGRRIPYLPVIDLLKRFFGIEEGDPESEIIAKIDAVGASRDDAFRALAPYLKFLLSVDPGDASLANMDPQLRRAGILDALRTLVLARARLGPAVIVVEDLHWIDEQSQEALAAMINVVGQVPVLMLLTHRPEQVIPLGERSHVNRLALSGLTPADTALMAAEVLGAGRLPESVLRVIASKSDGNPFFVEEVTRSLLESGALVRSNGSVTLREGADKLAIPDTIQEVITSRIDRLQEPPKRALQLASVIGREFTVALLDRISDPETVLNPVLAQLKTLELIYEKSYFPELAYMFKHALTHDVAYASLLVGRRRALHQVVGAAIEELYGDRLAEYYEMLAHHYLEGEVWEKALEYAIKAADKAGASFAMSDAVSYYQHAIELARRLGRDDEAVHAGVSRSMTNLTLGRWDDGIADIDGVLEIAGRREDSTLQAQMLGYRSILLWFAHRFDECEKTATQALQLGRSVPDEPAILIALSGLVALYAVLGRQRELDRFQPEMERLASTTSNQLALAFAVQIPGLILEWKARYEMAIATMRHWRQVSEQKGVVIGTATLWNQWTEGIALGARGDYDEAFSVLRDCVEGCERIGEIWTRARVLNTLGWLHGELQDHEEAMLWNARSLEVARILNDPEVISNPLLNLGDSLVALGRLEEAEAHFKEVEQVARNPRPEDHWMLWRYSQHLFHSFGELCFVRGELERALSYADECVVLAESTDSPKNEVKGRRLRAQVYRAQGLGEASQEEFESALRLARKIGNPPQLWKTLAAAGHPAEALQVVEEVAGRLRDERLRTVLLESAQVRAIREAAAGSRT